MVLRGGTREGATNTVDAENHPCSKRKRQTHLGPPIWSVQRVELGRDLLRIAESGHAFSRCFGRAQSRQLKIEPTVLEMRAQLSFD